MAKTENSHTIEHIRKALRDNLPGKSAHQKMLPPNIKLKDPQNPQNVKQSGVLLLLYPHNGKLQICFIRRPDSMKFHGGQIAFPGGKYEQSDKNLVNTALRESKEEIGIKTDDIIILGELTTLYVSVSNFYIKPVVGYCISKPNFKINNHEVEELITLPVEFFNNKNIIQVKEVETSSGKLNTPCFVIKNQIIWGATAMILAEFLSICNNRNFDH
jgi:8-oxo-dGTP pyrophosphatase MutT (NUDIX family)